MEKYNFQDESLTGFEHFLAEPWSFNRKIQQKMIALEIGLIPSPSKPRLQSSHLIHYAMTPFHYVS